MLPDLAEELTLHQGLEPQAQFLLAALITGRPVQRAGERLRASLLGARLLEFVTDIPTPPGTGVVADHRLRAAPEIGQHQGGFPDLAVFWPDRLALVELKTDHSAERPGQMARYAALGRHHYPKLELDLVYITRDMSDEPRPPDVGWRTLLWTEVATFVREVYAQSTDDHERATAISYVDWFEQELQPVTWPVGGQGDEAPDLQPLPASRRPSPRRPRPSRRALSRSTSTRGRTGLRPTALSSGSGRRCPRS